MILRKALLVFAGFVCLALAAVGFVIPILPGFLFLILAIVCFSAASRRVARLVEQNPRAARLRRRWHAGSSLPLWERLKLMLWLTADSAVPHRQRHRS